MEIIKTNNNNEVDYVIKFNNITINVVINPSVSEEYLGEDLMGMGILRMSSRMLLDIIYENSYYPRYLSTEHLPKINYEEEEIKISDTDWQIYIISFSSELEKNPYYDKEVSIETPHLTWVIHDLLHILKDEDHHFELHINDWAEADRIYESWERYFNFLSEENMLLTEEDILEFKKIINLSDNNRIKGEVKKELVSKLNFLLNDQSELFETEEEMNYYVNVADV